MLSYWKEMLALRKKDADVFRHGKFEMMQIERSGEDLFAYKMSSAVDEKQATHIAQPLGQAAKLCSNGIRELEKVNWTQHSDEHWKRGDCSSSVRRDHILELVVQRY